jgi:tRNA(fMet)-specific endonuclease VapC
VAFIVDTSVLIDAERGGEALEQLPDDEPHLISVVTVSELLHGVHRAVDPLHRLRRQAFTEHVLAVFEPASITLEIARVHAEIDARLADIGKSIDAHDLWIAATALMHGVTVATRNARHFERVPGLEVLAV